MIFITVAFLLYTIIVAEVATVQTYVQLCREDYRWWWQSFFVGASSGLYLFILGLMTTSFVSFSAWVAQVLCFLMLSATVAMIGGTIAVIASFEFNRFLFGKIKKVYD